MSSTDVKFNSEIFRKDYPVVIASNRANAILRPVRLRYDSGGYLAGTVLARNTTDGLYQKYDDGGSSGINTANSVLFESHPVEDFDSTASTGSTIAVAIFGGGVLLYKDNLTGLDANGITDLKATSYVDANGVNLLKF